MNQEPGQGPFSIERSANSAVGRHWPGRQAGDEEVEVNCQEAASLCCLPLLGLIYRANNAEQEQQKSGIGSATNFIRHYRSQ